MVTLMATPNRMSNFPHVDPSWVMAVCVTDMPDQLLKCVANYLPPPSQAIFAVALRAPSSSWCNGTSCPGGKSEWLCELCKWDVLDFEEIDKNHASKLDDDDVGAILMSINAKSRLERLKLAGLVNMSGKGLNPIRGSTKLKQIDLSLLGKYDASPPAETSNISETIIVPILRSIVMEDGCSLRQLQMPKKWCGYRNRSTDMNSLTQQYNNLLHERSFECEGGTHEAGECFETDGQDWIDSYCQQRFTCYKCLNNFCDDPALEVVLSFCERCRKSYCEECSPRDAPRGPCCCINNELREEAGTAMA